VGIMLLYLEKLCDWNILQKVEEHTICPSTPPASASICPRWIGLV